MKNKIFLIFGIIVAIGAIWISYSLLSTKSTGFANISVKKMDLIEEISTTGGVKAAQEIPLSFERSGRVISISANAGDQAQAGQAIVTLDSSDLQAQILQAQSALEREQIKLQELQGVNAENLATSGSQSNLQTSINNSEKNLADKITSSYASLQSTLGTYVYQFFSNPNGNNPNFGISIQQGGTVYNINTINYSDSSNLNYKLAKINSILAEWSDLNKNLNTNSGIQVAEQKAEETLSFTQGFLNDLASIINSYQPTDSTSQLLYNGYKSAVSQAIASVNSSLSTLRSADQVYNSSKATASPYEIQLEQTAVKSAQAQVQSIQAQINKTILRAPINGLVTVQNAKIGEIANPGAPVAKIISQGQFQIEAYVSETDVAKIQAGNNTKITLDAYGGSDIFDGKIIAVDPAETIVNGIGSYKITIQFLQDDSRIKPGMTANVKIQTAQATGVMAVPKRSVITRGNDKFILVQSSNGEFSEQKIQTGIEGSNGYVQITSGISEGDKIANFGN
jgi:HlyD family secretion protein